MRDVLSEVREAAQTIPKNCIMLPEEAKALIDISWVEEHPTAVINLMMNSYFLGFITGIKNAGQSGNS